MSGRSTLKFKVVIDRRPGMSSEEFRRHLTEVRGLLANKLPGRRRYEQNHVRADRKWNFPGWNRVIELYFDDWAAMESCLGKSGGRGLRLRLAGLCRAHAHNLVRG